MEACTPYFSVQSGSLDQRAPVIIVCRDPARSRSERDLALAGWRASAVALDVVRERMGLQANASCMIVEADGLDDREWEQDIRDAVGPTALPLILSGSVPTIDRMAAFAEWQPAEILIDPTTTDFAMALGMVRPAHPRSNVHDVSSEPSAARLRQLSDEVGRIAATLARLSTGPSPATATELPRNTAAGASPDVSGDQVRAVIRARRQRARYFDAELFADPAWDMLLDLLQAEIAQHRVPVSSLCIAAAVPPTTALRWIKTMTDAGLFNRRADPHDGRRVFVELSSDASIAMRRYFSDVGPVAAV